MDKVIENEFNQTKESIVKNAEKTFNSYATQITNDEILKIIENKYNDKFFQDYKLSFISTELRDVKIRLEIEIKKMYRISNVNLAFGVLTTIMTLGYLSYSLLSVNASVNIPTSIDEKSYKLLSYVFILKFIPRLSVSIFIEIFSFFFLRIYRRSLDDIKYMNNERTNVELKLISLESGILNNDENTLSKILIELSKTERNFILKKGESTVEVEKEKLEGNFYKDTLETVAKVFKK